jgi:hypothetical protein
LVISVGLLSYFQMISDFWFLIFEFFRWQVDGWFLSRFVIFRRFLVAAICKTRICVFASFLTVLVRLAPSDLLFRPINFSAVHRVHLPRINPPRVSRHVWAVLGQIWWSIQHEQCVMGMDKFSREGRHVLFCYSAFVSLLCIQFDFKINSNSILTSSTTHFSIHTRFFNVSSQINQ